MRLSQLFPGFRSASVTVQTDGQSIDIPFVTAGRGPPVLLLHGFPQTKAMWHAVAPTLAERFTVVASDLRGYGDASKPDGGPRHQHYSKRAMAADQVALMRALGHERFALVGHDRGGRVAHRLALDHADAVARVMFLDIAPTLSMYERTDMRFAMGYWHWFFLVQPAPLPETLIGADPEFMLRAFMGTRHAGLGIFDASAWSEYVRCARDVRTLHAMCEDYRASATIDLEHDRADRAQGRRLAMPVRILWGRHGLVERCCQPIADWREVAEQVDGRVLDCGHYIAEELPEALCEEVIRFAA